ncbi:DHS-like NAD/FAD-binding domain-containing protein [Podospora australis]|uniref:DHS-like NAD/FAD-binding domain-containing protein n=1 Tax=Podospora australis TaxID=1536484 RepID=A0AAN6WYZ2_9PEZI|nr:DHS-like NAD/FAD-binding domain-containing protein [Podospora australis]
MPDPARRVSSKKNSPAADDKDYGNSKASNNNNNNNNNNNSSTDSISRKSSTRVKNIVDYDEKRAYVNLSEDTIPPEHRQDVIESGLAQLGERLNNDLDEAWETESFYADLLEEMTDENYCASDPNACSREEAGGFRRLLRAVGPEVLIEQTVNAGLITAKRLLTAFGIRPPECFDGAKDEAYYGLLSLALQREINKRAKLLKYNTIDDAVALLNKAKNIIVLTGAGISTSLGIPDFRSKGMGLYSKLAHLGLNDPQEVFDIRVFRQDPSIFYQVAKDILPSTERFSPTHAFIALLQDKGKLLTNYSQNIDNLEAKAGIKPEKLIQCHGSFATATCVKCGYKVIGESLFPEIRAGKIPRCQKCTQAHRPTQNSRKRKLNKDGTERKPRRRPGHYDSNSDSEFDHVPANSAIGVMKPDITFFGEPLPDEFSRRLTQHDKDLVDLVIVIGTSLKVAPVSEVVPYLPSNIPQICISRDPITHINFDIDLLGDCDIVVAELCRRAGWNLDHEMIPKGQVVDVQTEPDYEYRHRFIQVHPPIAKNDTVPGPSKPDLSSTSTMYDDGDDDDSSELSSSVSVMSDMDFDQIKSIKSSESREASVAKKEGTSPSEKTNSMGNIPALKSSGSGKAPAANVNGKKKQTTLNLQPIAKEKDDKENVKT